MLCVLYCLDIYIYIYIHICVFYIVCIYTTMYDIYFKQHIYIYIHICRYI